MREESTGTLLSAETSETQQSWSPPIVVRSSLGTNPMWIPSVAHRRREPRIEPAADRIWIQWWDGEELLGRSACLVNVSRHGAMIVTSALPRESQSVHLYLEEPAPQVSVKATVLGTVKGVHGVHQVRLEFNSPCPDGFFEAAACGFESWLKRHRTRV